MKHKNWFWGIFFLAAAIFIIVCQTVTFLNIGFWSIAATVLLAAVFISSLVDLNFFGLFVSAALLYLIYQGPFQWFFIAPWLLLLAAVLAAVGFSIIFHNHWHHDWNHCDWHDHCAGMDSFNKSSENIDGNDIYVKNSFSESYKYLHADCMKSAHLSTSFAKLGVYFDEVQLSPEGAEAFVDVSFGEMTLFIPKGWRVVDHVHASFGSVDHSMRNTPLDANAPTITLSGGVSFGSLEIDYV